MDTRLLVVLLTALWTIALGDEGDRCYTCMYGARRGGDTAGVESCVSPRETDVQIMDCHGECYTVHVDIPEEDVTYVHRGCLPSCRNNEEYPVMNYGTGTIECCVGDLCNLATHVTLSGIVIVTTTLLAVVHVLL